MSDVRPVWLTENEAEDAGYLDRWDAAPADAAEAAQSVFVERYGTVFEGTPSARYFAEDVLRALGMPDASRG